MEILFGLVLVVGLVMNKTAPQHMTTELSDGTVVYMKASKEFVKRDKAARRAALKRSKPVAAQGWRD